MHSFGPFQIDMIHLLMNDFIEMFFEILESSLTSQIEFWLLDNVCTTTEASDLFAIGTSRHNTEEPET